MMEEEKKAESAVDHEGAAPEQAQVACQKDYGFNFNDGSTSTLPLQLQVQLGLQDSDSQEMADVPLGDSEASTCKSTCTNGFSTTAEETPAPSSTTTMTSTMTCTNEEDVLQHKFSAGDHVIRWELLPIAWPIQVHGIVLEAGRGYVSICDFGLTAEPRQDLKEAAEEVATTNNKGFQAAWDKVKPPDHSKKQRITVHLITTMEDLKAWKKVNYGHGLFGGGGGDDETLTFDQASHHSRDGDKDKDKDKEETNKPNNLHHRVGKWWHQVTQRKPPPSPQGKNQNDQDMPLAPDTFEPTALDTPTNNETFAAATCTTSTKEPKESATPTILGTNGSASVIIGTNGTTMDLEEKPGSNTSMGTTNQTKQASRERSPRTRRRIFQITKRSESRSHSPVKDNTNNKNKLPKSDPPKLVVARTIYLLAHGESVLPPYHPFKANSECIAVFCKTGRWSTLQASVFLHSTAIGNAKSSMAMTLGVAASAPFLAPAIAGIGIMAVGAPYVILNHSREFWQHQTLRLNDLFWAQAEPEVFVECIEHWSKLDQPPRVRKPQHDHAKATRQSKTNAVVDDIMEEENDANSKAKDESTTSTMEDSSGGNAEGEPRVASNPEKGTCKDRFVSV